MWTIAGGLKPRFHNTQLHLNCSTKNVWTVSVLKVYGPQQLRNHVLFSAIETSMDSKYDEGYCTKTFYEEMIEERGCIGTVLAKKCC